MQAKAMTPKLQREQLAANARGVANRLAVNCQKMMREIERQYQWQSNAELRHWWAQMEQARLVLTQVPPVVDQRSRIEREIDAAIAEAMGEPVEAPPSSTAAAVLTCGSAGSGGVGIGGGIASSTPEPDWRELVGQR